MGMSRQYCQTSKWLHQELVDCYFPRRINFYDWERKKTHSQRDFFYYVLFADEARFHKNSCLNRHNFHYFSGENPYELTSTSQIVFKCL